MWKLSFYSKPWWFRSEVRARPLASFQGKQEIMCSPTHCQTQHSTSTYLNFEKGTLTWALSRSSPFSEEADVDKAAVPLLSKHLRSHSAEPFSQDSSVVNSGWKGGMHQDLESKSGYIFWKHISKTRFPLSDELWNGVEAMLVFKSVTDSMPLSHTAGNGCFLISQDTWLKGSLLRSLKSSK